jgi:hypothetical protein
MTSVGTVISYPIPAYQNVAINAGYFQPRRFVISAVILGNTTTITTTEDMNYVLGQEVRLLIPASFGCFQLNGTTGFVISLPALDQVEVNIDSSMNVNDFILSSSLLQSAQIVAIGDVNQGIISATGRNIPTTNVPGAFINISPL